LIITRGNHHGLAEAHQVFFLSSPIFNVIVLSTKKKTRRVHQVEISNAIGMLSKVPAKGRDHPTKNLVSSRIVIKSRIREK